MVKHYSAYLLSDKMWRDMVRFPAVIMNVFIIISTVLAVLIAQVDAQCTTQKENAKLASFFPENTLSKRWPKPEKKVGKNFELRDFWLPICLH